MNIRSPLYFALILTTLAGAAPADTYKATPAPAPQVIDLGSRLELFVDHFLIDKLDDARLALHRPKDMGPVLGYEKPWEGPFCGYTTLIKDGPLYRMYYRGQRKAAGSGNKFEVTCVAESKDGINWTKPELGLYEVCGTRKNNVVLANDQPYSHNFSPFVDTRPDVPKSERYKALAGHDRWGGLVAFASPDGLHWRKMAKEPVLRHPKSKAFDSQNVSFWSEAENCYVCYFRTWTGKNSKGMRLVSRATSKDFLHWNDAKVMEYRRGGKSVPTEHIYTNQTNPYFRAPHIHVGIAARFMPDRQAITAEQAKSIGVHANYFKDVSDGVLLTTRGGNRYDRTFMEGFLRPGIGPKNWVSRTNYPSLGIVQTGPDEMSMYMNSDYAQSTAYLRRFSLRLDGFASIQAGYDGGQMLTKPFTFKGKRLLLNFATSAAGSIRVEIQDFDGRPIPGFTLADSDEIIGNEIERAVSWKGKKDVVSLAGRPIRLRFVLKDADLYAIRFE